MFSSNQSSKLFKLLILLALLGCVSFSPNDSFAQDTDLAANDFKDYKSSPMTSGKWDDLVKKGFENFHAEKYEDALENLYKAFNKGCRSPIAFFMMALIYEDQGHFYSALENYKLAEENFAKANSGHRYNKAFAENYGRALYHAGKKEEAYPFLKKAAKSTKSYWILKMLGMMAFEKGDTLNATASFEMAVRLSDVPKSELLFCYELLARLFVNQKELDGALRYYTKVLELDPQHPEASEFVNQYRQRETKIQTEKKMQQDYQQFKKMFDEQ